MKIKQSFTAKCEDLTIQDIKAIATIADKSIFNTAGVFLFNLDNEHTNEVLIAAANVLKISLSDIYETEQLPNTHYEIL